VTDRWDEELCHGLQIQHVILLDGVMRQFFDERLEVCSPRRVRHANQVEPEHTLVEFDSTVNIARREHVQVQRDPKVKSTGLPQELAPVFVRMPSPESD
jgi:hypothetical protein